MSTIYKARTTSPSTSDKNWIYFGSGGYNYCIRIDKTTGSCLPNCVGYAWGRWRELLGAYHNLSRANAENWYLKTSDGYSRGSTPKVGSIICWRKGEANNSSDGAGHVGVVEKINSDGSITVSNSNYSGTRFYLLTLSSPYKVGTNYTFQGFIYPPVEYTQETSTNSTTVSSGSFLPTRGYFKRGDTHENIGKIASFMYKTFPAYTSKNALGNYFGKYIESSIKEFQSRAKKDGVYNDSVDGCIGPKTLSALVHYGFTY